MSKKVIRLKEIIDEIKKDKGLLIEKHEKVVYINNKEKEIS